MGRLNNLINKTFHRLKVMERCQENKHGKVTWMCLCECGKYIAVSSCNLVTGNTKSCGCFAKDSIKILKTKHGHKKKTGASTTYTTWRNMISRCTKPQNREYKNYGGRGIYVCDRWMRFIDFLQDMGVKPIDHTLERMNNNDGYYKENCRWVSLKENSRNRRNTVKILFNNKQITIGELAEKFNINYDLLWRRIRRDNWSAEKAIQCPIR